MPHSNRSVRHANRRRFPTGIALAGLLVVAACTGETTDVTSTTSGAAALTTEAAPGEATVPSPRPQRGFDLQGHRGLRGLRPENTLPGFEYALDLMVDTLEFDLHLSADDVVVVWHDPVIDPATCETGGQLLRVRGLTAEELGAIRCDQNPDPGRFPEQAAEPGAISGDDYSIATLAEVFALVDQYADDPAKSQEQRSNAETVRFNVETKRDPDDPRAIGDGFDGTAMGVFETSIIDTAQTAGVLDRVTVQSFDLRSLWTIHVRHPDVSLAALTRRTVIPEFDDLRERGASIWSPDYRSVDEGTLAAAHDAGLLVIPWTVNTSSEMRDLLDLGVDGLITDRPDLAPPTR